jgi:EamA-like transporter family protein
MCIVDLSVASVPRAQNFPLVIFTPALVYDGTFGTCGVYGMELWCVKHAGPTLVAITLPSLNPLFVFVFEFFIFGEIPPARMYFGGLIIMAGLLIVLWARSMATRPARFVPPQCPLLCESVWPHSMLCSPVGTGSEKIGTCCCGDVFLYDRTSVLARLFLVCWLRRSTWWIAIAMSETGSSAKPLHQ